MQKQKQLKSQLEISERKDFKSPMMEVELIKEIFI